MINKLKYILFDFSDGFKNDFIATIKKSIVFLIVGIVAYPFKDKRDFIGIIAGIGILGFGFIWGRNLTSALVDFANITTNVILKWTIMIIMFLIGIAFGYIYFVWCLIKMLIIIIKNLTKNKKN